MVFRPLWSRNRIHPPHRERIPGWVSRDKRLITQSLFIIRAMALIILATGCATPKIQTADPQLLFKSELLSFVQDGVTTREEVVLKLGMPSAQIEGEKILLYQLRADEAGKWHLTAPLWNVSTVSRTWREGTCSLVNSAACIVSIYIKGDVGSKTTL